jgi:hypothetical protein
LAMLAPQGGSLAAGGIVVLMPPMLDPVND